MCRRRVSTRPVSCWRRPRRNDRVPPLALLSLAPQIPCKHVFCYDCALLHEKKGDKMCPGWVLPSAFRSPLFNTLVCERVTAGVWNIQWPGTGLCFCPWVPKLNEYRQWGLSAVPTGSVRQVHIRREPSTNFLFIVQHFEFMIPKMNSFTTHNSFCAVSKCCFSNLLPHLFFFFFINFITEALHQIASSYPSMNPYQLTIIFRVYFGIEGTALWMLAFSHCYFNLLLLPIHAQLKASTPGLFSKTLGETCCLNSALLVIILIVKKKLN